MRVNTARSFHYIDLTDIVIFVIALLMLIREAHVYIFISKKSSLSFSLSRYIVQKDFTILFYQQRGAVNKIR